MRFVTIKRLNSALADVIRDFDNLGIWNDRVYEVDVFLVPFGHAFGWKWHGEKGHIAIPRVSLCRLGAVMGLYSVTGLRDILRHEYGHVYADLYPDLSRTSSFRWTFGSYGHSKRLRAYDPDHHVTPYAAVRPSEDFCETWMYYIKHRGNLPARFDSPVIRSKWRYAERMIGAIRKGRHTL
jgi:hypothetical protein